MMRNPLAQALLWLVLALILAVLYLPLLPPFLASVGVGGPGGGGGGFTWRWYGSLGDNPLLAGAIASSLAVALITAVAAPLLALLAAMAVRELRAPRLILLLVLLPLFIPGVSLGLATALFLRELDLAPSLWSIVLVHILWALPFATLIILTAMASFDPVYLEAAYLSGAGRFRAFGEIELPLIRPGILGAASFAMILSFNETIRTSLVQGPLNTVQTYIWSTYLQVGLSPGLYALMSLLVLLTVLLLALSLAAGRRTRLHRHPASSDRRPSRASSG